MGSIYIYNIIRRERSINKQYINSIVKHSETKIDNEHQFTMPDVCFFCSLEIYKSQAINGIHHMSLVFQNARGGCNGLGELMLPTSTHWLKAGGPLNGYFWLNHHILVGTSTDIRFHSLHLSSLLVGHTSPWLSRLDCSILYPMVD